MVQGVRCEPEFLSTGDKTRTEFQNWRWCGAVVLVETAAGELAAMIVMAEIDNCQLVDENDGSTTRPPQIRLPCWRRILQNFTNGTVTKLEILIILARIHPPHASISVMQRMFEPATSDSGACNLTPSLHFLCLFASRKI